MKEEKKFDAYLIDKAVSVKPYPIRLESYGTAFRRLLLQAWG